MVEAVFHAHADLIYDSWLFQGRPSAVFANLAAARASNRSLDASRGCVASAMRNIRRRRDAPGAAPLVCSYMRNSQVDRIDGVDYQRSVPCVLLPPLEDFLLITFHKPQPRIGREIARAHSYVKLYYATDDLAAPYVSDWLI